MTLTLGSLSVEHMVLALVPPRQGEHLRGFHSWEGDNYVVRQHSAVRGTYHTLAGLAKDWPELASLILEAQNDTQRSINHDRE
jgi:hypothetical protein